MIARIYDKDNVRMSTYLNFKDKNLDEVKQWFADNILDKDGKERVSYIYSLLDDKEYRWNDLSEIQ